MVERPRNLGRWLEQVAPEVLEKLPRERSREFRTYLAQAMGDLPRTGRNRVFPFLSQASRRTPLAVPVARVDRDIVAKIASTRSEWQQAFELVARCYRSRGYEASTSCQLRFTPFHALPNTVTFVALMDGRVVLTVSLVPDNRLLGLPLESIYGEEVRELRRQRRRLAEVISLSASSDIGMKEFRRTFMAVTRLLKQYHVSYGGDTWVITVNPRHSDYYTKALGYQPLGPRRNYAAVGNAPAEAYVVDRQIMATRAPKSYEEIFGEPVPGDAFLAPPMPPHMVRYLGQNSNEDTSEKIREVFDFDEYMLCERRW